MATKVKSALVERIRGVLAHNASAELPHDDLPHDVVAVLAEAAILLEVQCEEAQLLFNLIPVVIERFAPSREPDVSNLSSAHLQDLQALHDAWHRQYAYGPAAGAAPNGGVYVGNDADRGNPGCGG